MSNIFSDETRNEDQHKRFSVLAINSQTLETFYHFDVQGMSGSVDVFYGPNESGKFPHYISIRRTNSASASSPYLSLPFEQASSTNGRPLMGSRTVSAVRGADVPSYKLTVDSVF